MVLFLNRSASLFTALALVLLTLLAGGACQGGEALTWDQVNAEIQKKFPDVKSLGVEALNQKLAKQEDGP